jgi:hypothetical protein
MRSASVTYVIGFLRTRDIVKRLALQDHRYSSGVLTTGKQHNTRTTISSTIRVVHTAGKALLQRVPSLLSLVVGKPPRKRPSL